MVTPGGVVVPSPVTASTGRADATKAKIEQVKQKAKVNAEKAKQKAKAEAAKQKATVTKAAAKAKVSAVKKGTTSGTTTGGIAAKGDLEQ